MPRQLDTGLYLVPTYFMDFDSPAVSNFAKQACRNETDPVKKAISLYYAVRDGIRYDPYSLEASRKSMKASAILNKKHGYCVAKAVLLAAVARHQGIPARLGFADVKNHLNSKRLRALMETDLFIYHGFTELYLDQKWVKATPAFDKNLCSKAGVMPLEFDGTCDSIFHAYNTRGDRHMEYVKDHGNFSDLPYDLIIKASLEKYPLYFKNLDKAGTDFASETIVNP